jgi:hypothetical protein
MGTSQSSDGPGGGVPMVPSWTPPPPAEDLSEQPQATPTPPPLTPVPLAPPARFRDARRALGDYARSGDRSALGRSVGHYVRTGYGGAGTAARRFGGTAATAAALGAVLARGTLPGTATTRVDAAVDAAPAARDIIQAIIEAVRPIDGTLDAEASRAAIGDALAELLERYPEADLLHLDADQRVLVIEQYTAIDVCRRFELDLGKTIAEKAPSASAALARGKEARDYIRQTVAASFRKLRDAGRALTGSRIGHVVRDALRDAFQVFEGYAE